MIIVDTKGFVIGFGLSASIVDAQGETDLIKVIVHNNGPNNFYYIGTEDRNNYTIYGDINVPDESKQWNYIDGNFEEIIVDNSDLFI